MYIITFRYIFTNLYYNLRELKIQMLFFREYLLNTRYILYNPINLREFLNNCNPILEKYHVFK